MPDRNWLTDQNLVARECRELLKRPKDWARKLAEIIDVQWESLLLRRVCHPNPWDWWSTSCLEQIHFISESSKQKRLIRPRKLFQMVRDSKQVGKDVFSNEKLFTIEAKFNRRNARLLAKSSKDFGKSVKVISRRQGPQKVMVNSKTWKSSLIFVPEVA